MWTVQSWIDSEIPAIPRIVATPVPLKQGK